MRLKPIQLRCRPAMQWPSDASLDPATRGAAKPGKPQRDLAEQRRDRLVPAVLHTASAVTARAFRPPNGVIPGLRGDNLLLNTREQPLRFGQGQTQVGDVAETIGPVDLHDVRARPLALNPGIHQPQNPSHASILGQRTDAKIPDLPSHPQSCGSPVIGGSGTLFGPLFGAAVWLYLRDLLQGPMGLGSAWRLVLGLIFVLLMMFLRRGLIGGVADLATLLIPRPQAEPPEEPAFVARPPNLVSVGPTARQRVPAGVEGAPILETSGISKRYGGIQANRNISFTVQEGELRGIIGPNGAGKSTFFKMLTCEVHPTEGSIRFHGQDITGFDVSRVCQLGLTKSYQINQLFGRLTVRQNLEIAGLAARRGRFRLDLFRRLDRVPGLREQVQQTLALVNLVARADMPVADLAYGEKRRLEIGLALASSPTLLLLDEPLAGMSPRERAETVQLLKNIRRGRTMVIIDHDMDALFELAERITVLHEGQLLAEGTPAEIQANRTVQDAYLGGMEAA